MTDKQQSNVLTEMYAFNHGSLQAKITSWQWRPEEAGMLYISMTLRWRGGIKPLGNAAIRK